MLANQVKRNVVAGLAICLIASAPALHATLPQLYPTFSTPTTITTVNLYGTSASPDDMMAETTLQGAYNQLQGSNRLYISLYQSDEWWLQQSAPSTITVSNLSFTGTDPDGALKAMLAAYGPQGTNSVSKYIICDPINNMESCNMATTMAGINDAMVVYPDNLSLMSTYGMTLLTNGDLRNYFWVGSTASLVGNTNINWVHTPGGGGGGGTTGWANSGCTGSTLGTATYLSVTNAIEWTAAANTGTCWTPYGLSTIVKGTSYVFSVQVAGSGTVYLDAWQGTTDIQSSSVVLNSTGWQTLQVTVPIPSDDNSNPVQIQVRANTSSNAVTAYFINAAVVSGSVAVDTYQYNNLIASTSTLTTSILATDSYNDRDYIVAGKIIDYYLGSSSANEVTLFGNILNHCATNTPVMGWVENEGADVPYLSGSGQDHFITVSDRHRNGSVWASLPGPSSLSQPAPAGIKAQNGHIYVSFGMSDGDNSSFMQEQEQARWTTDPLLGAVPLSWTESPISIDFSPEMLSYYYKFLPQSEEMEAGPSGVSYEGAMTGSYLTTFANLSNQFMTALDMSTVNGWQDNLTDLTSFATTLDLPFVIGGSFTPWTQLTNSAGTVMDAQEIGYNATPAENISAIQSYVNAHWSSGAPLFINTISDNGTLFPSDMLYIAQQLELQKASGQEYVFLTPAEMALTEVNYHKSGTLTATENTQARTGTALLASYPQNYVQNPNGLDMTNMSGLFTLATTGNHESLIFSEYLGLTRYLEPSDGRIQLMTTQGNTTNDVIAEAPINNVAWNGGTYDFQMLVAGSGTAKIGVYNGSSWTYSSTVTLTSAWQPLHVYSSAPTSGGEIEVIIPAQTAAVTLHFAAQTWVPYAWDMDAVVSGSTEDLTNTTYNYTPALLFTMSGSQGHTQEIAQQPMSLKASTSYVWSVDVAGSGSAHLLAYEGSGLCTSSTVTLTTGYQTLTCTGSTTSSGSPALFVVASVSSSAQTIYVRNASAVPAASLGTTDFTTGVETGQTPLTWTNTVDTTSPGGNESNVSSAVLQLTTSEMSHGGSNAIQYGGTASGGTTNYAYMEAFSNSTTLTSTSRLSYWIYPQTPHGAEPNASSTTALNSTCVAIDIIFTDGTTLRGSTRTDQYWNPMNPSHQCGHLQPDKWNYVTADLSPLSGKTISRIDVGYDQPNAPAGSYRGYIDDITLKH